MKKVGIPVRARAGIERRQRAAADEQLGQEFHHEAQADSVIAAWKRDMASALADTASGRRQQPPRVLIMHMGQIANNYLGTQARDRRPIR